MVSFPSCRRKYRALSAKLIFHFQPIKNIITGRNEVVAKVMFLHVCVILFTGGGPGRENPPGQGETPRAGRPPSGQGDPPGRDNPPRQGDPPRQGHPPRQGDPPGRENPPPGQGDPPGQGEPLPGIRSMSGRYASYWNAFLFVLFLKPVIGNPTINNIR